MTKWVSTNYADCEYITSGKLYEMIPGGMWSGENTFSITGDDGKTKRCLYQFCAHIGVNDWTVHSTASEDQLRNEGLDDAIKCINEFLSHGNIGSREYIKGMTDCAIHLREKIVAMKSEGEQMTPLERLNLEIEAAILDVHDQDVTLSLYAEAAAKAALDEVQRMLKDGVDMTEPHGE